MSSTHFYTTEIFSRTSVPQLLLPTMVRPVPCADIVSKCTHRLWLYLCAKAPEITIFVAVLACFLYQIQFLVKDYLERPTVFVVRESAEFTAPFPPITLCPWPNFHPQRLASLGLNTSVTTGEQLMLNVEDLTGIDRGLTGRRLVEEAAWRLEELVEELEVGNIHQIYNESNMSSQFWQRSFSPIGPCLTLTLTPLASLQSRSLTLKLRQHHSDWDECTWTDEGIDKRYSGPQDCSAVHQHCNRSCIWEQFITQHYYRLNFIYLQSSSLTLDIPLASTDLRILNSQGVAIPFEVIHLDEAEIGSRNCHHRCLADTSETTSKCIRLSEATQGKQLRDLCMTQSQQYSLLKKILLDPNVHGHCKRSCKPNKREFRWVLKMAAPHLRDKLTVNLSSTSTIRILELEVYPFSQLMSDIGGSLGLYMGTSLLDLWKAVTNISKTLIDVLLLSCDVTSTVCNTVIQLSTLSGQLAISMMAFLHVGLSIMQYGCQPTHMEVSFRQRTSMDLAGFTSRINEKEKLLTAEDLVMAHLASRPLGCRLISHTSQHGCFVKCLMHDNRKLLLPLVSTDDLPLCSENDLRLPNMKYVATNYNIQQVQYKDLINACNHQCRNASNPRTGNKKNADFVVREGFQMTKSKFLCQIGGIIGLYYGFSLLQSFPNLLSSYLVKNIPHATYKILKLTAKGTIAFACIILILDQVQSFLFDHPVSTSLSFRPLQARDMPAVTVCMWPPFNVQRLLEVAGLGLAYEQVTHLNPDDKHTSIIPLLQRLNEAPNVTTPDQLWSESAWKGDELELSVTFSEDFFHLYRCDYCSKNFSSVFNQCHTFQPLSTHHEVQKDVFYHVNVNHFNETISVYLTIHSRDDFPVAGPEEIATDLPVLNFFRFSLWSGLYGDTTGRGKCMSACLEKALQGQMGCILPWAVAKYDLPVCNMNQFADFVTGLWSLGPSPRDVYSAVLGARVTRTCSRRCHQKSSVFFGVSSRDEHHVAQTLTIGYPSKESVSPISAMLTFHSENFESVKEHDRYPLSQLLCEIGGIAGMTLGTSLASVMEGLMAAF